MQQSVTEQDERIGHTIGGYSILRVVADGAMGRVYEACTEHGEKHVAIKILHDHVEKDDVAVQRFAREAEAAQTLKHPNIIEVYQFGQTPDGRHFMVMEFLEGEELSVAIRRDGKQSIARVVSVVSQMALALEHAHSFGYIHRDLKPENVFLMRAEGRDQVKILDFGSVKLQMEMGPKLTAFGTTLGSPYYMSPEQAVGKQDVDQRSDVFAVGAILYEMLTGQIAFAGNNVATILMKIMQEHPMPPSIAAPGCPEAVDQIVDTALSKDKTARYPSVQVLADDLCAVLNLGVTAMTAATASYQDLENQINAATAANNVYSSTVDHRAQPLDPPSAQKAVAISATPAESVPIYSPKQNMVSTKTVLLVGAGFVGIALLAFWLFTL